MNLHIIPTSLLNTYLLELPKGLERAFNDLKDADLSTPNFSFYTSVASVFSSKIEGEPIELDSYIKHRRDGMVFQPDYTQKTDDLYRAYEFARANPPNDKNVREAHKILAGHLVTGPWQGRYRIENMYVATENGKIEYVAALPGLVTQEMNRFYADLESLLNLELSVEEVFYFSAFIHLVFVKIHPWIDGNGRSARLLEKWFLAQKLGSKAWFVQSEKMYYQNHSQYYHNLRLLGLEYQDLDFGKALPFLKMLPTSVFG